MPSTPSPAIPSFTDGTIVHQADLNALASNLTNLYNYNHGGFFTQRPCVLVNQTTGQVVSNATHTTINFQNAIINNDSMWVASVANQITIQHAGIYFIFGQVRWPATAASVLLASILVNGTAIPANLVVNSVQAAINNQGGQPVAYMANLAVNATIYLDVYQNSGGNATLFTDANGSTFGAFYVTGP